MNLYRVTYVYRPAPDAMPQEKVCFVAAEDHNDAVALVNADPGNEVSGANVHVPKIRVVPSQADVLSAITDREEEEALEPINTKKEGEDATPELEVPDLREEV